MWPTLGPSINSGTASIIGLNNSGQITNQASGGLELEGTSFNFSSLTNNGAMFVSNTLNNYGQLQNNGTVNIDGFLVVQPGGAVLNNGSIVVTIFASEGGVIIGVGSTLTNAVGSSFVQNDGHTYVYGTMNSAPVVQLAGGTLLGTGTINGDVNNSFGIVQPGAQPAQVGGTIPGTLTINGNYTQGSNGLLDIELLGNNPGGFSVLDVSGLVTLDGTLDFFAFPGFTPEVGGDFTFLLFGSLSGQFANVLFEGWACPVGDTCDVVYGAHGITLDIDALGTGGGGGGNGGGTSVPEPGTGELLLGAIATMFCAPLLRKRQPAPRT